MSKAFLITVIVILFPIILFSVFSVAVRPGEVAIKVDMYGHDKGVQAEVLPTGRNFYNAITHDVIKFPTYIQQKDYKEIQFQDVDGMMLSTDVAVAYKFSNEKIADLYVEYRRNPRQITEDYFPTWIRNAMVKQSSTMKVDEIYGTKKEQYRVAVKEALQADFSEKGIIIDDIYFTKEIVIPEQVKARIDSKIQATQIAQQKENELAAVKADVEKRVAEEEGKARSRIIESESRAKEIENLTAQLSDKYIAYLKLDVQKTAVDKWNGVQPTVVSGNGDMIFDISSVKQ